MSACLIVFRALKASHAKQVEQGQSMCSSIRSQHQQQLKARKLSIFQLSSPIKCGRANIIFSNKHLTPLPAKSKSILPFAHSSLSLPIGLSELYPISAHHVVPWALHSSLHFLFFTWYYLIFWLYLEHYTHHSCVCCTLSTYHVSLSFHETSLAASNKPLLSVVQFTPWGCPTFEDLHIIYLSLHFDH